MFKNFPNSQLLFRSSQIRKFCNKSCPGNMKPLLVPNCKVALITGGSEGIGFAIANQFLAENARHVALIGVDTCKGREAVNILNCTYGNGKSMFLNCNITAKVQLEEAFKVILQDFGKIDILVNSAGVCKACNWEEEAAINFLGTVRCMGLAICHMSKESKGQGGLIINISGTHGLQSLPSSPTLSANLHAIIGLSKSFGSAWNFQRTGIRVVTLCPGVTQTNFIKDLRSKGYNETMGRELQNEFCKRATRQRSEVCGKAALHLLKFGQSGTVWVVDGSKLYSLEIPDWRRHSKLVSQYL